jgi:hypothetical protein
VSERRLAAAIVALAAVGFCREAYFHFWSEPRNEPRRPPIDTKFAPLFVWLPRDGEAGYVTDDPIGTESGKRRFLETQYALAPIVLRYGDGRAPLVVANVADPSDLDALLAGRTVVARAGPGIAAAK